MKISYCSDLHTEFAPIELENKEISDVLVLAGDIFIGANLDVDDEIASFFESVSRQWKDVLFVFGNHEFYHGQYKKIRQKFPLWLKEKGFDNITVLDPGSVEINGVLFVGATMWTSMKRKSPLVMMDCQRAMNDYYIINYDENRVLTPSDTADDHDEQLKFVSYVINKSLKPTVVITHHAPSGVSIAEQYKTDPATPAYYEQLEYLMLQNEETLKLWIHGHTHYNVDYMVGSTRVVSNQRGYHGRQAMAYTFELKTVEV